MTEFRPTRAGRALNARLITGSIARSATRRYLSYEADIEVFRPAGATRTLHRWA